MNKTSYSGFTPQDILADGKDFTISTNPYTGESGKVRKGTVAATINNVALLNEKLVQHAFTSDKNLELEITNILNLIIELLPSLKVIGLLDLFKIKEWLADFTQQGRILIAIIYLRYNPHELTKEVLQILNSIKQEQTMSSIVIQEISNIL